MTAQTLLARGTGAPHGMTLDRPWRVTEQLVRRCGLPLDAVHQLRDPELAAALDRACETAAALDRSATELTDLLHDAIAVAPPAAKAALVGLRRSIRRGRRPAPAERSAAEALPAAVSAPLTDHLARAAAHQQDLDRLDRLAADAADRLSAVLRPLVAEPALRHGLALAGPTLLDEVERWDRDGRPPQRQKLLRLAKYVARAATKTSPYATLTDLGRGRWSETPSSPADRDENRLSRLEVDGSTWTSLRARLTAAQAHHRPLRINPSLTSSADRHHYLGRVSDGEPVLALPRGAATDTALELVDRHGASGWSTAVAELAVRAGQGTAAAAAFLDRLIDLGAVEVLLPAPDLDRAPWAALAAAAGPADPLAEPLQRLAAELDRSHPVGPVTGQRRRLRQLRRSVAAVVDPTTGPAPVLHETVVRTADVALSTGAWSDVLADLDLARRWLAVFDPAVVSRVVLAEWWTRQARPGRIPFLELHRQLTGALRDPAEDDLRLGLGPAAGPWAVGLERSASPRLQQLLTLRDRAAAVLDRPGPVAVLDPHEAADLVRDLPPWATGPASVGCYLQAHPDGTVLNALHVGFGRAGGRFDRLRGDEPADRAAGLAPAGSDRPLLAEFGADFGSSMNGRRPRADVVLDYPFAVPGADGTRLPLADLTVEPDPTDDGLLRLWSRRLDRPVVPVHLGMSAGFVLPPAARTLERCFGASALLHPSAPPLAAHDTGRRGGRAHHPRVTLGRLVLQRERWCLPRAALPARLDGTGRPGDLLALATALHRVGAPTHFFARAWSTAADGASKDRKPSYVDLGSSALAALFERLVADADLIVVEEALPDPLLGTGSCEELFVELSDEPVGRWAL